MGYVGIDSTAARRVGQVMQGTSIGAGRMRQQIVGALAVAQLDSVAPGLLARVEDGLAELGETITGRAAAADRSTVAPPSPSEPGMARALNQLVPAPRGGAAPLSEWLGLIGASLGLAPVELAAGQARYASPPDGSEQSSGAGRSDESGGPVEMELMAAGQTLDSGPPGALATLLAQNLVPDAAASPGPAGATGSALRLPATPEAAADFLAEVRARFDQAPNEPIRFNDNGMSVTILKNPEGFPVLRQSGQTLTDAGRGLDTPAYEAVIDGQQTEAVPDTWLGKAQLWRDSRNGPVDLNQVLAQGIVVADGNQLTGRTSPMTFYLALDTPDPANPAAPATGWRIGAGDPPPDAHLAFGGGVPVIINGIPYGITNQYLAGAPANLPQTGEPGAANDQFLTQRSNKGFTKMEEGGGTLGKTVTALGPDGTVYIVVEQNGASGVPLSSLRDTLGRLGVRDAVSWDGSDSSLLMVDGNLVVQPGQGKNNFLPAGIGFRLPFSEQGLTNWVSEKVPGTSLSFAPWPFDLPGGVGAPENDAWDLSGALSFYGGTPADSAPLPSVALPYYGGAPADSAPLPAVGDWNFGAVDIQPFDPVSTFGTSDVLSAYPSGTGPAGGLPPVDLNAAPNSGDDNLGDYDLGEYDTGIYDPGTYDPGDF